MSYFAVLVELIAINESTNQKSFYWEAHFIIALLQPTYFQHFFILLGRSKYDVLFGAWTFVDRMLTIMKYL